MHIDRAKTLEGAGALPARETPVRHNLRALIFECSHCFGTEFA
jgi:hypothetical protein